MTENWVSRCPDSEGWRLRILRHVSRADASGCWFWTGRLGAQGYGAFSCRQPGGSVDRHTGAHRASYLAFVGELAIDMTLDHLCRTPLCVNPDHLEPVTAIVNTVRASRPALPIPNKPRCAQGHPLSAASAVCEECPVNDQPAVKWPRPREPRRPRPLFISPTVDGDDRLRDIIAAAARFKAS